MNLKDLNGKQLLNEYNNFYSNFLLAGTDAGEMYKTKAELLSRLEQIESLKCCGNCSLHGADGIVTDTECPHIGNNEPESYCDKWQSDGMSRQERVIK